MDLWIHWYGAIRQLRPGFSRELTFLWFALSVAGLSVRADKLGISSIVRALSLDPERCYQRLLKHCRSKGIKLTRLQQFPANSHRNVIACDIFSLTSAAATDGGRFYRL